MSPGAPASYTERFLTRERLNAAFGRMLGALAAAPLVAGTWWGTCERARAFDAGRFRLDDEPVGIVLDLLWVAVHARFGIDGLHVAFGAALALVAAVGVHAWLVDRRITRELGPRAVAELAREDVLREPAVRDALEEAQRRGSPRMPGRGAEIVRFVRLLRVVVPFASVALTAWLVSKALRT